MARVLLSKQVDRWLSKQDSHIEQRLRDGLEKVGAEPDRQLDRMTNSEHYRAWLGSDHRAIVEWDKQSNVLKVHEIGKREGFYE